MFVCVCVRARACVCKCVCVCVCERERERERERAQVCVHKQLKLINTVASSSVGDPPKASLPLQSINLSTLSLPVATETEGGREKRREKSH